MMSQAQSQNTLHKMSCLKCPKCATHTDIRHLLMRTHKTPKQDSTNQSSVKSQPSPERARAQFRSPNKHLRSVSRSPQSQGDRSQSEGPNKDQRSGSRGRRSRTNSASSSFGQAKTKGGKDEVSDLPCYIGLHSDESADKLLMDTESDLGVYAAVRQVNGRLPTTLPLTLVYRNESRIMRRPLGAQIGTDALGHSQMKWFTERKSESAQTSERTAQFSSLSQLCHHLRNCQFVIDRPHPANNTTSDNSDSFDTWPWKPTKSELNNQ